MLDVKNLHVSYGNIRALQGIDFHIDQGEIVTIIGANGAGKTTTLRAISQVANITEGTMTFKGKDLRSYAPEKVVSELGISHVPEGRRLFGNLTVTENLKLGAFSRKDTDQVKKDIDRVFEIFPRLLERKDQKAGTMSGGEQAMVSIGRGLMSDPKLLIIDEPSLGLSPAFVNENFRIIKRINESGVSVFLVEQNVRQTLAIAHYGYVLSQGKVVARGEAAELQASEEVQQAYFG